MKFEVIARGDEEVDVRPSGGALAEGEECISEISAPNLREAKAVWLGRMLGIWAGPQRGEKE